MTTILKSERLLHVARATLERGDLPTAREVVVLALRSGDAMEALDKLLPRIPEPEIPDTIPESELELSDNQVAQIRSVARALFDRKKRMLAHTILARLERIDAAKKKRRQKV